MPLEENFPDDLSTLILTSQEQYGSHDINISEIWNSTFSDSVKENAIVFTINGIQFEGVEGDTWEQWIPAHVDILVQNGLSELSTLPVWNNYIGVYIGAGTCIPALCLSDRKKGKNI